jgi:hypothetical protein
MGPLVEAFAEPEPEPRYPKAVLDWSEEEWATYQRIERARAMHEAAPVTVPTTMQKCKQFAFDFLRPEFVVAPRDRKGKRR